MWSPSGLSWKILAQQKGMYATFIAEADSGLLPAAGCTCIRVFHSRKQGQMLLPDPGDPHGLSMIARRFIAGQLAHARGMCAVLAPLVNSYKRLGGYEAPVHISWGGSTDRPLIRIPRAHTHDSTRIELRCPDPSCNPYLAFAVMLAAGLDGNQGANFLCHTLRRKMRIRRPKRNGGIL